MNKYQKAVAVLHKDGFESAYIYDTKDGCELWITVWSDDLQSTLDIKIHEDSVVWFSKGYETTDD